MLTGPPGCGKSTAMRVDALAKPGLYLFAMPSIALIREQADAFRAAMPGLDVTEADSKAKGKGSFGSVQKRLDATLDRITGAGVTHAVVFISHEALMARDLSGFSGWHVRIDEAPNALQGGKVKVPASTGALSQFFSLTPVGGHGWAEVGLANNAPPWRDLENDSLLKSLAEMIKRAGTRHGVFVDQRTWTKEFGWCSIWLPTALSHFASCHIAGAAYPTSLGAVIAKRWLGGAINFIPRPIPMVRTGQPNVRVHYFTQSHEGTSHLWEEHVGREFIVKVCDFLAGLNPPIGYWSGNEEVQKLMDWRVPNGPIKL